MELDTLLVSSLFSPFLRHSSSVVVVLPGKENGCMDWRALITRFSPL